MILSASNRRAARIAKAVPNKGLKPEKLAVAMHLQYQAQERHRIRLTILIWEFQPTTCLRMAVTVPGGTLFVAVWSACTAMEWTQALLTTFVTQAVGKELATGKLLLGWRLL